MTKKVRSVLISVFYKDGLEKLVSQLNTLNITIYSTGGTQLFIENLGIACTPVEKITSYPSILGGRVKTLHPGVFGGILAKRNDPIHLKEMHEYNVPEIDMVIVDLYPFEETVKNSTDESVIIEKIDIGGPSMIRAAAKNFFDVVVIAEKKEYDNIEQILKNQNGETTLEQRRNFAIKAFDVCTGYDLAISNYFNKTNYPNHLSTGKIDLRYGENPHQKATFNGDIRSCFEQVNGKELSYNNLIDVDAAFNLMNDIISGNEDQGPVFAIVKHTNVCGIAKRATVKASWDAALAGDPESAFGGILITNVQIDKETAQAINELFFEVLICTGFEEDAIGILRSKKSRILLKYTDVSKCISERQIKTVLNGTLEQQLDIGNYSEWLEVGGKISTENEKLQLKFANIVCKHLKSNAIAIIKENQLIGKGCGQTSRIDALKQALEKSRQFGFELGDAVLASDAFFPFDDCVKIAHKAGIKAFIQPGGSIRDKDSIAYCKENDLSMVLTGTRHFKH